MSNARTLANLVPDGLDDYEEGTWTPTVTAPSGSTTASVTYAKYRKVGSVVFIDMLLVLSSSSGSGNVGVTLPFSFSNTGGAFAGNSRTNAKSLSCLLQSSTNAFDFYRYDGSTAVANETYAITGFYFIN